MTQPISGRVVAGTVRLLEALRLRRAISSVVHGLPPSLRRRLSWLQVRAGYMQGLTLVPEEELQRSYEAALRLLGHDVRSPSAAYLEFGVYVGTSMACMYRATSHVHAGRLRLVGFDSFQGMPQGVAEEDDKRWHAGELYSDVELTRQNLRRLQVPLDRIELVAGWYEESLTDDTRQRLGLEHAAVVMIDCVISSSARVALEFCTPLIRDRTVVYFDDWAVLDLADRGLGERAAFESWLTEHPELAAEALPILSYSPDSRAFMISRTRVPTTTGAAEGA
jgi:hypothetical protein